ncbi:MAG TPA: NAD(P)/FAD-dependent oxidoreductase [Candidatus Woesearchaeota archaeon]|nr:MAG: hypothetical protein DRJ25_00415 [Candidatus Woesearchaeota archaeon]HDD70900.1 NAD(P)/FAD-dependent oxidoreductase [Candidatus Woesearchaeota archaeon]
MRRFDVVVIGAGIAGLRVAKQASKVGLDVCLIEKNRSGGKYVWWDIPLDLLTWASRKIREISDSEDFGFSVKQDFDFVMLLKRIRQASSKLYERISSEELGRLGIKVLRGAPRFVSKNVLELNNEKIVGRKFVIATGSKPYIPNFEGLDSVKFLTSEDLLSLKKLPKSVCVIGGGVTGVELAFSLSRFGCQVALLEQSSKILADFDDDIGAFVQDLLEKSGVKVFSDVLIKKVYHHSKRRVVEAITDKKKVIIKSDELFLATGKLAYTEGLNLNAARVRFDEDGIKVNKRCRTSSRKIFACGDVTRSVCASQAVHQADVVLANLLNIPKFVNFSKIPLVVSTDPVIAMVGKTEKDLSKNKFRTIRVEFKDVDVGKYKSAEGFLKLVLRGSKIVGVVLAHRFASELINNYALVIGKNIRVLRKIIFPIPGLAQINSLALEKFFRKKNGLKNALLRLSGKI